MGRHSRLKKLKRTDWWAWYNTYLHSKRWQSFRSRIIRERWRCERCKAADDLHVHHLTYQRAGKEEPKDVLLLCKRCHKAAHLEKDAFKMPSDKAGAALVRWFASLPTE